MTPRTIAHQASLSMGLSRQEYWSGLSFPPPGDFPDPGIKPVSPASLALQEDSLPLSNQGNQFGIKNVKIRDTQVIFIERIGLNFMS